MHEPDGIHPVQNQTPCGPEAWREGRLTSGNAEFPLDGASEGPAAEQLVLEYLVPWDWVCSNGAGARGNGDGPRSSLGTAAAIPGSSPGCQTISGRGR